MTVEKTNEEDHGRDSLSNIITSMSVTYSDLVYPLTQTETETDAADIGLLDTSMNQQIRRGSTGNLSTSSLLYLPNEFQVIQESTVPLLMNLEHADHDFIIIAEFSELEGPIPICTIPSHAPDKTDINLSSFAVHLMSTDYQVNTVGQFCVCEDTQVLRTNVFKGVHVFMQYFTLYDIKARGFVRPFCFGYVSKDNVKLDGIVKSLIEQFSEVTKVLKYTNRAWFASELTQYLTKLCKAKEEFIFRTSLPIHSEEEIGIMLSNEENNDSESISLNQIAQQYTEIENILKAVKDSMVDPGFSKLEQKVEKFISTSYEAPHLYNLIRKLNFLSNSFMTMDIPLVHPLKQKGESLRPLTSLGQKGTITLVQDLMMIHQEYRRDLVFTQMRSLAEDFRNHFLISKQNETITFSTRTKNFEMTVCNEEELCRILEKIHSSVPILVSSDNKSGSYHSLSSTESELMTSPNQTNGDEVSYQTAVGSVESISSKSLNRSKNQSDSPTSSSFPTNPNGFSTSSPIKSSNPKSPSVDFQCTEMGSSWTIIEPVKNTNSQTFEDDASPIRISSENEVIEIQKCEWWAHASKTKLQKGDPGYGIRKFWIQYPRVAHHVFFSILIGRPIIFYGSLKHRSKVTQIINSLVPFIPCYPAKSFKVLHWLQGIMIRPYLDLKLIGLCIPERHTMHELVDSKYQNSVTLFDIENKKIIGPAYSGEIFKNFENIPWQKNFFDDLSLMTYFGSILTELETLVYMCKSMQIDGESSISKIMKNLDIKDSDIAITKHLSSLIQEPEQSIDLF